MLGYVYSVVFCNDTRDTVPYNANLHLEHKKQPGRVLYAVMNAKTLFML